LDNNKGNMRKEVSDDIVEAYDMRVARLGNYKKIAINRKLLGSGIYHVASIVSTPSEIANCAPYACSAIFVYCTLGFNKQNFKAMIDTGCETVTITCSIAEMCNLFIDTNQKWGLITATGVRS